MEVIFNKVFARYYSLNMCMYTKLVGKFWERNSRSDLITYLLHQISTLKVLSAQSFDNSKKVQRSMQT